MGDPAPEPATSKTTAGRPTSKSRAATSTMKPVAAATPVGHARHTAVTSRKKEGRHSEPGHCANRGRWRGGGTGLTPAHTCTHQHSHAHTAPPTDPTTPCPSSKRGGERAAEGGRSHRARRGYTHVRPTCPPQAPGSTYTAGSRGRSQRRTALGLRRRPSLNTARPRESRSSTGTSAPRPRKIPSACQGRSTHAADAPAHMGNSPHRNLAMETRGFSKAGRAERHGPVSMHGPRKGPRTPTVATRASLLDSMRPPHKARNWVGSQKSTAQRYRQTDTVLGQAAPECTGSSPAHRAWPARGTPQGTSRSH
jgi:hypothetical protein